MSDQRKLASWIESFVEYTDGLPTPEIYRRWGAINALAGLLERRVWVTTSRREVYPNLYTLLVGPPGVGKSEIIREIQRLWKEMKDLPSGRKLHIAPDNMTKAALVGTLAKASTRMVLSDVQLVEYHSLLLAASEFSVFLPAYDNVFMSVLTDLFDCRDDYNETRISTGETRIPNPQLHFIGGTTPGYMATTFPETAWTMGFSSRLIMVYAGSAVTPPLFGGVNKSETLWKDLVADAKSIVGLYGELRWSPDAQEVIESWNSTGRAPEPSHPKLTTYNTRRILQVLKLITIASISRSSEMLVRVQDVVEAIAWLTDVEQYMADIFKDMQLGGGSSVLLDLHHWALGLYNKSHVPLREGQIINFLAPRMPTYQVLQTMQLAMKNGMFTEEAGRWTPVGGQ